MIQCKRNSKEYGSFENFNAKFNVTDSMIDNFKKLAEEKGVEWNDEQYLRSESMIKLQIKALIARNEWDMEKYYQVVLKEDKVINKAIDVLNDSKEYRNILKRQFIILIFNDLDKGRYSNVFPFLLLKKNMYFLKCLCRILEGKYYICELILFNKIRSK